MDQTCSGTRSRERAWFSEIAMLPIEAQPGACQV
jgi:hypothetical protein